MGNNIKSIIVSIIGWVSMIPYYFSRSFFCNMWTLRRKFKNKYRGKRCFIIGNGPSLKNMDLSHLKDEYTFGLNRVYLMFDDLGFKTSFLVSINNLLISQCGNEISKLQIPKFILWRSKGYINTAKDIYFLNSLYGIGFSKNIVKGIWEGATVTYAALQIAYYMGFRDVYLIGVDHNFTTKGEANKIVALNGEDPNHFSGKYFGNGFRWQLPDLESSEEAYKIAKEVYQQDGRRVLDATVGGKLKVFKKVSYKSLF